MSPRIGLDADTIVEAAAGIADREGWEAVTLSALAAKLGVRSPSLYNHVNGLPELRSKLAVYGIGRFTAAIEEAVQGLSGEEAIHALANAYLDFARTHPGLYESTLRDQSDPVIQAAGRRIVELMVHVLQSFGLDEETGIHLVRGFRSLLHGFVSIDSKGGFGMPLHIQESIKLVLDTFMAGIKQLHSS
ncbi:TetR/AcrR family transcriptional regulator [Paenibacillus protaetiae]|uniref:TetR/AcrR family transcriptional regulator n=1 Tax=Paenibacillus protaetiae TaxID=2509456 RepID=A0A4V0YFM0_9BACL|nr:TetR/AcrR family transcriptional regulator [Paenibacillus protaetiae]QAY68181.1 TetR/AcrR family transcriptional regulator [Paenibacillus protaetiae]